MTRLPTCRWILCLLLVAALPLAVARACPFCSAVAMTLSEEMKASDAAILARLVAAPAPPDLSGTKVPAETARATFEVVERLKGPDTLKPGSKVDVLFFGEQPVGSTFLIIGTDPKDLAWGTPTPLNERGMKYVSQLVKLPETGKERLLFFQEYLEDKDALLAADAYDEFAKAPYAEVTEVKDDMHHDKLIGWIKSADTSTSRRRLYLTMLGICGTKQDVPQLEAMIKNEDRQARSALDALIACYLNLTGPAGVPLVEDLFLKNAAAEYTDTYSAIMALRFHGQETTIIPRERLVQALEHMLDRPQLADLVIPDLARWQDWGVMDRLVKLFKDAKDDTVWVRVPVINFLRACPLPEAKEQIEALKKIDPESVARASQFFPLGAATPPPGAQRPKKDDASGGLAPPVTKKDKKNKKAEAAPEKTDAAQTTDPPPTTDPAEELATTGSGNQAPLVPPAEVSNEPPDEVAAQPLSPEDAEKLAKLPKVRLNQPAPSTLPGPDPVPLAEVKQERGVLMWSLLAAAGVLLVLAMILRGSQRNALASKSP